LQFNPEQRTIKITYICGRFSVMSIEVKNITKTYQAQKALDGISFSVKSGEIVGFLGPNGAGKSTLMKILTTFLPATEGIAIVNGFDVKLHSKNVQKSVGYLPEHNPLYVDMYVREYLQFNANVYNIPLDTIASVIIQTGLTPVSGKKIKQLSKGYRQRVGLANALLHDPQVLILDEPTTGLDPNQLVEIRALIKNLGGEGQGKTILLSTHIMQEVEAICERVIIIDKGSIVLDKKLEELSKNKQQIIEVEFDCQIEEATLLKISHIIKVENMHSFMYHIYCDTEKDMRGKVFDFAQNSGLKILQLHRKNTTLETLFIELTA
jgi:ABC-2 type transport system ATP-binding protein